MRRRVNTFALLALLPLVACVSGPVVTNVSVTATPAAIGDCGAAEKLSGQLDAVVSGTGAFDKTVNWSVTSVGGGTLSATTGASVTYTLPTMTAWPESVTVRATSAADAARFGDVNILVKRCMISDRNLKTDIRATNGLDILNSLARLPIASWRYRSGDLSRHLGPMAQDFAASFKLGASTTSIATVDEGGVALAAIQALNAKLQAENAGLRADLARLDARLSALERRQ